MISTLWLHVRAPYWQRLDDLVRRAEHGGLRSLTHAELREVAMLYRQAAADLATVREDASSERFAGHLNHLLARAHHIIYAAGSTMGASVWRFLSRGFPAAVVAHRTHLLASIAVFVVGSLAGIVFARYDPGFTSRILGPDMLTTIDRHQMWTHSIVAMKPLASSAIMTNNMTVALTMFAMGVTAGLGTVYMLFFNGLLIAVVGTACASSGMSLPLWSFVAPHGVLELPAIFIAGSAGLRLAQGVLFPGLRTRRVAVATAGRDAVRLIAGCMPLLLIAGLIEAFISPTDLATSAKFAMAAALFLLLNVYLFVPRARAS
jgi:uncharacterized membrane protein SpoIIM required for sporulation